jgi:hypothetical protein
MKFVLIPGGGTFLMGSLPDEEGSIDDERQHEVTQALYMNVTGRNPSYFTGAGKLLSVI